MDCVYTNDKGRELNFEVLRDVFDGDVFKLLAKAREYKGVKITFSLKTIERAIVSKFIEAGWSDEQIQEAMSTELNRFDIYRIKRIRERMNKNG